MSLELEAGTQGSTWFPSPVSLSRVDTSASLLVRRGGAGGLPKKRRSPIRKSSRARRGPQGIVVFFSSQQFLVQRHRTTNRLMFPALQPRNACHAVQKAIAGLDGQDKKIGSLASICMKSVIQAYRQLFSSLQWESVLALHQSSFNIET